MINIFYTPSDSTSSTLEEGLVLNFPKAPTTQKDNKNCKKQQQTNKKQTKNKQTKKQTNKNTPQSFGLMYVFNHANFFTKFKNVDSEIGSVKSSGFFGVFLIIIIFI